MASRVFQLRVLRVTRALFNAPTFSIILDTRLPIAVDASLGVTGRKNESPAAPIPAVLAVLARDRVSHLSLQLVTKCLISRSVGGRRRAARFAWVASSPPSSLSPAVLCLAELEAARVNVVIRTLRLRGSRSTTPVATYPPSRMTYPPSPRRHLTDPRTVSADLRTVTAVSRAVSAVSRAVSAISRTVYNELNTLLDLCTPPSRDLCTPSPTSAPPLRPPRPLSDLRAPSGPAETRARDNERGEGEVSAKEGGVELGVVGFEGVVDGVEGGRRRLRGCRRGRGAVEGGGREGSVKSEEGEGEDKWA
ncbi:hypothetical protein K523DRAFT_358746 [Schizophyllum commune Tattone D]|nr:hypothetical protein K523DRAFT_358746 [Schizophyllum commune Tattone D]